MRTPFPYMPQFHKIIRNEPPFMSLVRKRFPGHAKYLFLYQHSGTGMFVIGGWAGRGRRRLIDVAHLGPFMFMTTEAMINLTIFLSPRPEEVLTAGRLLQVEQDVERRKTAEVMESTEELLDLKRHVWKKYVPGGGGVFWDDVRHKTMLPQRVGA